MIEPLYDNVVLRFKGLNGQLALGRVIAVGPGRNFDGTFIKPHIIDGDLVWYPPDMALRFEKDHYEDYLTIEEQYIIGKGVE